ncbi:membrane transporter [Auriculariales sp. MPI-PUGE-AT-0066]|nr:membrane transporter [Auriculariales sp. MPI-PUGE-AT-0066]
MSAMDNEKNAPPNDTVVDEKHASQYQDGRSSITAVDLLSSEHTDIVLDAKMRLVNNAIDQIGFTNYQWKLFCLNGFGYAVDSLILLVQSVISGQAALEFRPSYPNAMTMAAYVGMLIGALFWGTLADAIGRKLAFNSSLLICSIFAIIAGAAPSWPVLGLFIALSAIGGGGNLVLDTTVFLEYLPSNKQWMLTIMAAWWGIGQLITGLFAWAFLPKYSCADEETCTRANNMGWRYVWFASGALVFVMSILRVTVIRLEETPKYLLSEGKDQQIVDTLQGIARKYNRPCSLTIEQLTACGVTDVKRAHANARWSPAEAWTHVRGLFATKRLGYSTGLLWLSWTLIGLAYPLFNVFLPTYLQTRGAQFGVTSDYIRWRNYAIVNVCGILGPIPAGYMCATRLGRRGTMVIGALISAVFFFAYTQIRNNDQSLGFSCAVNFSLNIYYGTLYGYTPEVLPSAHRGTGNGIAIACNRVMGIISAVVATEADTSTSAPIWLCASLYIVMAASRRHLPLRAIRPAQLVNEPPPSPL